MRKKILVVALMLGMTLSLTACSSEKSIEKKMDKIATVTIDGDKYVLTGDFQEVVGSMVENGTDVRHERTYEIYDEEGMFSDERLENDNHYILAQEDAVLQEWSEETLVYDEFVIRGQQFDFESKWGITSDSKKKDIKELEGFVKTDAYAYTRGEENYAALYVDGKMVDLSKYKENYKEWLNQAKEEGITAGLGMSHQWGNTWYLTLRDCNENSGMIEIEGFVEAYDKSEYSFEKMVTLQLAIEDALQKMADGEVVTCSVVSFGTLNDNKDICMHFLNYYYDAEYDQYKFWNMERK